MLSCGKPSRLTVLSRNQDVAEEALAASNSEQEEEEMFFSIFLCFVILIGGTLIVYALRRRNLSWFPEAWVFYFIGEERGAHVQEWPCHRRNSWPVCRPVCRHHTARHARHEAAQRHVHAE